MPSKKLSTKKKIYKHSQTELQIQTKFIKKLKAKCPDAFIVKLSDRLFSGLPDVLMIIGGKAFFYEVKRKGEKPTEIQKQVHIMLQNSGAFVEVITEDNL